MIAVDFETSSRVDIKLTGAHVYAADPSTQIVCMAYAFGNEEVQLWTPDQPFPQEVYNWMSNGGLISCWNAEFERAIIANNPDLFPTVHPHQWRCSMAKAAHYGLPSSLKECAKVLNTPLKDESGQRAMRVVATLDKFMAKPVDKQQELLQTTYEYCKNDIVVERAINNALPDMSDKEFRIWQLDQQINHAGLPIDVELCNKIVDSLSGYMEQAAARVPEITGGAVEKPTQVARIKQFCLDNGVEVDTLGAEALQALLDGELPQPVRELLEIRQRTSKASTAKFTKMLSMAPEGRAYGQLKYYGAATGRWSGRGIQVQNLPRPEMDAEVAVGAFMADRSSDLPDPFKAAKSCLRAAIKAPEGYSLVVADYSGIEARVLAWLAGDYETCEKLDSGVDLYKDMSSRIYRKPVSEITSEERQVGKAAILGLGYGMGPTKFHGELLRLDPDASLEFAKDVVATYRNHYRLIRRYWYSLEAGAAAQVDRAMKGVKGQHQGWDSLGRWTRYQLPGGRYLHYWDMQFVPGTSKMVYYKSLTSRAGRMYETNIYSGKIAENVTQAVARDVLADAMLKMGDAGLDIVSTVHDEVVILAKDDEAQATYDKVKSIMEQGHAWTKGLPLAVEGYISQRYKK